MILFYLFFFCFSSIQSEDCFGTQEFIPVGCIGNCIFDCNTLWDSYESGGSLQDPTTQCVNCPQPNSDCETNAKCYNGAPGYTDSCNSGTYYDTLCTKANPEDCGFLNSIPILSHPECADGFCTCSTFTKDGKGYCKLNTTNEELCGETAYCGDVIPNLMRGGLSNCTGNTNVGSNCTAYCEEEYYEHIVDYQCDSQLGEWIAVAEELDCIVSCEDHHCLNEGNTTLIDDVCLCDCLYGYTGPNCEIDFKRDVEQAGSGKGDTEYVTLIGLACCAFIIFLILWYAGVIDLKKIADSLKDVDFQDTTDSEEELREFEKEFHNQSEDDIFSNPTLVRIRSERSSEGMSPRLPRRPIPAPDKRKPITVRERFSERDRRVPTMNLPPGAFSANTPSTVNIASSPGSPSMSAGLLPNRSASVREIRETKPRGLDSRHKSSRSNSHRSPRKSAANPSKKSPKKPKYSRLPAKDHPYVQDHSDDDKTFESIETNTSDSGGENNRKKPPTDLIRQYRIWE